MKHTLTLAVCLLMALASLAQGGYRCTYEMTMSLDDHMDQIADEGLRAAIAEQMKQMKMYFTLRYADGRSLFALDADRSDNPFASESGETIFVDFGSGQRVSQTKFFGRTFLIEEPLEPQPWEISNVTRQVAGRNCTKATLTADGHTATAWFCTEVPIPVGPQGYGGLPGLVVQLETDAATYTLVDLTTDPDTSSIAAPAKGKRMSREEYSTAVQERLQQMGATMGGGNVQIIQMR